MVKILPATARDNKRWGLIPLEEGMATHSSSCLENPIDRGASELQSLGSQRVRHD